MVEKREIEKRRVEALMAQLQGLGLRSSWNFIPAQPVVTLAVLSLWARECLLKAAKR